VMREQHPALSRAIFKTLAGQELLVVNQFKASRDTDAMLRKQGALQFIDIYKDRLNKFMEVID